MKSETIATFLRITPCSAHMVYFSMCMSQILHDIYTAYGYCISHQNIAVLLQLVRKTDSNRAVTCNSQEMLTFPLLNSQFSNKMLIEFNISYIGLIF